MPSKDLTFRFHGEDVSVAATMAKITAEGEAQSKKFTQAFGKIPAWTTLLAVAGTVAVSKMAADFQSQMTLLQTAGGETQKNIGTVSDGILKMAGDTGTSTSQLAEGMYTIEKAGIRGSDGLKVLKAAAEGAKAENVDLGTATNALTSVMMSYHLGADKAVSTQNMLVAGAGMAKTTMQEYAGSLSTVIPVASSAGIGFDQVAGAIATLTQHGTSAQESTQELANTIRALQAPNQVASKAMQQLGLNVVDVQQNLGKRGLTGTIQLVSDAITKQMGPSGLVIMDTMKKSQSAAADAKIMFDKLPASIQDVAKSYMDGNITQSQWRKDIKGMDVDQRQLAMQFAATVNQSRGFNDLMKSGSPAAQTFAGTLSKVMGGATGMNTALMLGGENMAYFKKATEEVGKAGQKSGSDISTWAKTQATLKVQAAEAAQALNVLGIRIGTALLPVVTPIIKGFADWTKNLTANKPALVALLSVVGAFTAVMVGAYGAQKLMVTWTVLKKAAVLADFAATGLAKGATVAFTVVTNAAALASKGAAAAQVVWTEATKGAQVVAWLMQGTTLKFLATLALQKVAMLASAAAQGIATAAQWAFNLALDANPIGIIVLAIAGLVAGLVWFFTQTTLGKDIWAGFTKFLGDTWNWLWNSVLSPVINAISVAFDWLYNNVIRPIVGLIVLEFKAWGIIFQWLHDSVIKPVSDAIGAVVKWIYDNAIKPMIAQATADFKAWGAVFTWLHDTIIKPVFDAISDAFNWLWTNGIKPVVSFITDAVNNVGQVFKNVFGPIGDLIHNALSGLSQVTNNLGAASNLPSIKPHAAGGVVGAGEISLVGEKGPELVQLPGGTRVFPTGTGPAQQGGGLHIENFYATPSQSPAQIAAELGWRARWAS